MLSLSTTLAEGPSRLLGKQVIYQRLIVWPSVNNPNSS
jgi:hypothetical protein